MTMMEWVLMLVFGVPIALLCIAFVVCATWLQVQEELREQTQA